MNTPEIISKLLEDAGLNASQFAKSVNLIPTQIYDLKSGKTKKISDEVADKILRVYPQYNKGWLMSGEGSTLSDNQKENAGQNMANETAIDALSDYETWLLPQTAHGGSLTNIPTDGVLLQNCEKIVSPIKGVDFAISIYGESMSPEYPSGSRVLIKKIKHNAFIDWGKAYVIDTCNGVILKEVLKCERDGFITCHSINPDPKYADFDVSLDDVYGIYRVLMCLSAK